MHHDLLENASKSLTFINCDFNADLLKVGFIRAHNLTDKEITVNSGTGLSYIVTLSDDYLNVPYGVQFNSSFPCKKVKHM